MKRDDGQDCPNARNHTASPQGYNAWFDWCARQAARGRTQRKCWGCGRYRIWTGSPGEVQTEIDSARGADDPGPTDLRPTAVVDHSPLNRSRPSP